ncbi:YtxH domain-containing protein, partial [Roseisolibacter sp. H3M3-2]|uniref:YtxH domain-containing protein n=1 Tax=Roseisolibacter sp. H3M3-2 TaxID=3031323 RepID=UPI0023DAFDF4
LAPDDRPRAGGTDWRGLGTFAVGVAVGALLGAGTALLMAPASGYETRVRLARRARHVGDQVVDRVDDWGDAVRRGARHTRTRLDRSLVRSRWAAEDAWDRRWREAKRRARAEA